MKNIIKKICSLLALIMIILNSSVLTTLSMAIDEISTNVTANVSNDKKEKVKIYTSYTRLTNRLPNELTITGILEKDTEDCALYENPVVYFEFPAEIEKVVVNDIKVLYDNELKLKDYTIEKNDAGNQVIKVSLEGKQTQYSTDGISQGTNIRIVANVIAKQDIKTGYENLTMVCNTATAEQGLLIVNATENNLKNISVKFPLGKFICITGVSGSGKSTLINEVLYKNIAQQLNGATEKPGKCKTIKGLENIDKIINIDQSPIGRTPRSNPATYTGAFDLIRDIFASTNEAKMRGYEKGRFSFNVPGGRCESCSGDGVHRIEMHFLPDVFVPCEVCKGKRYNRETLEVKYKGKSIADVLDMTVEESLEYFANIPRIKNKIQTLYDVGLGYIKLGQPSTTLSGGEAQRVKLATELSKKATGKTLYILDEPTTGLHIADVHRLVDILQRLVDTGNTIIVIEHNLDLIKTCDHIIDLGPEGGDKGGQVIAVGTPEHIVKNEDSYTGKFLKKYLN